MMRKVSQIQEDFLKMSGLNPDSDSSIELRRIIRQAVTEAYYIGWNAGVTETRELLKKHAQSSS